MRTMRLVAGLMCDVVAMSAAAFALHLHSNGSLFWAAFALTFAMDVIVMKAELRELLKTSPSLNRSPLRSR